MEKRARADDMISRYQRGESLQQIGDVHGLTRERVRQILRPLGVAAFMGGVRVRENTTKKKAQNAREAHALLVWGISLTERQAIKREYGNKPFLAYTEQRNNAKQRGVAWHFDFGSWWKVWVESGKWRERGRPGYCMAREGDSGPYAANNVYICTGSANLIDRWAFSRNHKNLNMATIRA
jgi:hypothetical protein